MYLKGDIWGSLDRGTGMGKDIILLPSLKIKEIILQVKIKGFSKEYT